MFPFLNRISLAVLAASSAHAVDFNREVQPCSRGECFACHGMDDHARKGKLRLDLRDSAVGAGKSGEIAIVPGKPETSGIH